MSSDAPGRVLIIGAGPAGLTAAYDLVRRGWRPRVLEASDVVGGVARTVCHNGYRFDVGGHRFYTKVAEVRQVWDELLESDLLEVRRLSRIYYRDRFFAYPLRPLDTLLKLGPVESLRVVASYVAAKIRPPSDQSSLEGWVTSRFGRRLYETFFATYTEKVWGVPGEQVLAQWAAQRIRSLSVRSLLANAFLGVNGTRTLIDRFHYPRLGPGMLWERCAECVVDRGGIVDLGRRVVHVLTRRTRVTGVVTADGGKIAADNLISSMPLPELVGALEPRAPAEILDAAAGLRFRALVVVCLIVDRDELFPDNWIYVHSPAVRVGRIQNFGHWSSEMVPKKGTSSLGMEYFCDAGDEVWSMSDRALLDLAELELRKLGLGGDGRVIDGTVIRQPGAYPVYDAEYPARVAAVRSYLERFDNLQTVGRNGLHRYNNQDHSMLTGLLAVRNLLGGSEDVWAVNTEEAYHEEADRR